MTVWVALWYSIVISPTRRVTKADLLAIGADAGLADMRTVLSTGNMIFSAEASRADLEQRLQDITKATLGKAIAVFCRTAAEWTALIAENPFPEQTKADPAKVAVRVMRQMPGADVLARMQAAAGEGEVFAATPGGLWIAGPGTLSGGKLLSAVGSNRVGEGTFRSASSIAKVATALP